MKKIAAIFTTMMLCIFCASAMAQGMQPAPKERVHLGLPEGMVLYSSVVSDGRMHIVIDTAKTDWDKVATAARKSGSLVIHPGIVKPDDALGAVMQSDYYRWENEASSTESESRILLGFQAEIAQNSNMGYSSNDYSCSYQGWAIGRYDEGTRLFVPGVIPAQQGAGFAAYWKMKDGSYRAERLRLTVGYTEIPPVYVRRQAVAEKDIIANAQTGGSAIIDPKDILSVQTDDGRVVYQISDDALGKEVFTAVSAPDSIRDEAASAYLLSNGRETKLMMLHGRAILHYMISTADCLDKKDWAIRWKDEAGNTLALCYLEAEFHVGNPQLTVLYPIVNGKPAVEPLPEENLKWTISNPLDGLSVSYQDGVFRMNIDADDLPPNRKTDLAQTRVFAQVMPPQGAVRCEVSMLKGDVIYGNSGERANILGELAVRAGEPVIVPELTNRGFFEEIYATLHNGKHVSYFVSPTMVGEYGGQTLIFKWIGANNQQIGDRQFVALTSDAYRLAIQKNQSLTMNPNKAVEIPTVQMDAGMTVETAELPQKGDNVVRYEIALLDGDGNKAQLDKPALLYLPYPDGKSMEESRGYSFTVHHQLKDGNYEEFSTQNGRLTLTPYGLCMEVTSFSPYFLNWEAADASGLPETGDSSNPMLYLLLLGACVVCAAALSNRGARKRS